MHPTGSLSFVRRRTSRELGVPDGWADAVGGGQPEGVVVTRDNRLLVAWLQSFAVTSAPLGPPGTAGQPAGGAAAEAPTCAAVPQGRDWIMWGRVRGAAGGPRHLPRLQPAIRVERLRRAVAHPRARLHRPPAAGCARCACWLAACCVCPSVLHPPSHICLCRPPLQATSSLAPPCSVSRAAAACRGPARCASTKRETCLCLTWGCR